MQSLTSQTFAETMTLCGENRHYKVCIVFDTRKAMIEFIEALRESGNIPNVRRAIINRADGGRLEFFNGSVLEIILGTARNIRSRRCNLFIASGVFDLELLAYMELSAVPYRATASAEERFFDTALFGIRSHQQTDWVSSNDDFIESTDEVSEELDAFLGSFVISENVNKTTL